MDEHKQRVRQLLADGLSVQDVIRAAHESKRRLDWERAKAKQAGLGVGSSARMADLAALLQAPGDVDELLPGGLDYLCQSVMDCVAAGDFEDTVHALVRVFRKAWALQPHLGPIQSWDQQKNG